jgi:tight adherence protein C
MLEFYVLIPILGAASAFLFGISLIPAKSPLTQTLEALESRAHSGTTANEFSANPLERVLEEVFTPEKQSKLARKLIEAGWYSVTPAQIVLRVIGGVCIGVIFAMLIGRTLPAPPFLIVIFEILAIVIGGYAPFAALEHAIERRKAQVQKTLPDFLDMVASTVQAGLAINAAIAYAVDAAPGALGNEVKEALSEVRLGRGRAEALKAAAARLNQQEFSTTINAITQAERLGANISKVLNELADDVRTHRIMMVEEHAAKLPVKMVFPMAFFLLPALFVIIFGTLVANYIARHSG